MNTVRFGLYPWFPEHGMELIHPNDVTLVTSLGLYGKVFEMITAESDFLTLTYGVHKFRVKPELFQEVLSPIKRIGEIVKFESKGKIMNGVVAEVNWHHQKNQPYYVIEKEGKLSSKRYWNFDFQ